MIVYNEPVPGLDTTGTEVTCNREVFTTREDAIAIMRYNYKKSRPELILTDEQLLDEFIVVHWAEVT